MDFTDLNQVITLNSDNFDLGVEINCFTDCPGMDPQASIYQYFTVWIENDLMDYSTSGQGEVIIPLPLVQCDSMNFKGINSG